MDVAKMFQIFQKFRKYLPFILVHSRFQYDCMVFLLYCLIDHIMSNSIYSTRTESRLIYNWNCRALKYLK